MRIYNCVDCETELPTVQYVRRLQPSQHHDDPTLERDKLCKPCWEKDNAKAP